MATDLVDSNKEDSHYKATYIESNGYYTIEPRLIQVVPLTVHTVRQAWVILSNALDYDLGCFIPKDSNSNFPDPGYMRNHVNYSFLIYLSNFSIGVLLSRLVTINCSKSFPKTAAVSSNQKSISVPVILAIGVLEKYRKIRSSWMLFHNLINKMKKNKIHILYALVNLKHEADFYHKLGFQEVNDYNNSSIVLNQILQPPFDVKHSGGPCDFKLLVKQVEIK